MSEKSIREKKIVRAFEIRYKKEGVDCLLTLKNGEATLVGEDEAIAMGGDDGVFCSFSTSVLESIEVEECPECGGDLLTDDVGMRCFNCDYKVLR